MATLARMKSARAPLAMASRELEASENWRARQGLASHGAGRGHIARGKARLGQIKAGQFMRLAAREHFVVAFLVEVKIASAMHLLVHVHAVNHLADGVFEAGGVLLELEQLLIEVTA